MSPPPRVESVSGLTPSGTVPGQFPLVGWRECGGHLPLHHRARLNFFGPRDALTRSGNTMVFLLWILAVILVVWGIVTLVRGQMLMGIVLIIVGLLVGPGGVSLFTK